MENQFGDLWFMPFVFAFVVILSWIFTRDERGGAINPDAWKCQSCFKNIDARAMICRFCGASTPLASKQPPKVEKPSAQDSTPFQPINSNSLRRICVKCFSPLEKEVSFCSSCGNKLS